jgi:HEAT repeat protein
VLKLAEALRQEAERTPALKDHAARLQQEGLTLKEALYRIVKTPGAGRDVRGGAAAALRRAGHPECVDILLNDFSSATEQQLIWEAGQSLETAGAKKAVGPLSRGLYDSDPERRYVAAHILGWLENRRAVAPLIRSLEDPAQLELVRGMCAESLAYLGSTRAIPSLIRSLRDPSVHVRFWSVFALGSTRSPSWEPIKDCRIKPALESVLLDAAVLPGYWSVGREALAALGTGRPTVKRYKARLRAGMMHVFGNPDAPPEDRMWAECYRPMLKPSSRTASGTECRAASAQTPRRE